jgi:oxygen-independent coproporphyrinogen-3 oxidase
MLHPEAEITLEANPTRTDRARFAGYRAAGVNRLSLGVQSLHGDQLALYQRTHTTTEAQSTFIAAREAGFTNISLDLIFGAPHQSFAMWQHTVDEAIAWQPEHFSLYSLIFERQTKLTHAVARGELPAPDDDLAADMYAYARHALTHAGYIQYELASFALPSRESAHNQQYWRNLPYLGLGPGAHGYVHPYRYQTVRAVPRYIEAVRGEGAAANFPFTAAHASHEHITEQVAMLETMMLGLRMVREGVSREGFRERFKQGINDVFGDVIPQLKAQGLLMEHGERLLLTEHAYLISNQVFRAFFP